MPRKKDGYRKKLVERNRKKQVAKILRDKEMKRAEEQQKIAEEQQRVAEEELLKDEAKRQRVAEQKRKAEAALRKAEYDRRWAQIRKAHEEERNKTIEWYRKYRPQPGQDILYREVGYDLSLMPCHWGRYGKYTDFFLGTVTECSEMNETTGYFTFTVKFSDYHNYIDICCSNPMMARVETDDDGTEYQYVTFEQEHLTKSCKEHRCYSNVFVSHLKHRSDYTNLIAQTWILAEDKLIYKSDICKRVDCSDVRLGHNVNNKHFQQNKRK